jgi:hypothetical protein
MCAIGFHYRFQLLGQVKIAFPAISGCVRIAPVKLCADVLPSRGFDDIAVQIENGGHHPCQGMEIIQDRLYFFDINERLEVYLGGIRDQCLRRSVGFSFFHPASLYWFVYPLPDSLGNKPLFMGTDKWKMAGKPTDNGFSWKTNSISRNARLSE